MRLPEPWSPAQPCCPGGTDLGEEQVAALIAGQHVIHQHRGPCAVLAQPNLVGTLGAQCPGDHHPLHQLWPLGQHGQGTQEPAGQAGRPQRGTGGQRQLSCPATPRWEGVRQGMGYGLGA